MSLTPIDANTLTYWNFDEGSLSFANHGNGSALTLGTTNGVAPTNSTGFVGGGVLCGGAGCMTTGSSSVNEPTGNNFTISFWVNPSNSLATGAILFNKSYYGNGSWSSPYSSFYIATITNNRSLYVSAAFSGSLTQSAGSGVLLTLNAWNLVAVTYDGSSIRLYINGGFSNQIGASGLLDYGTHGSWDIGGSANASGGYSAANFDEVRIENTVRSASYISAMYAAGISNPVSVSASLQATSSLAAAAHASYKVASPLIATSSISASLLRKVFPVSSMTGSATMGAGAHASYKVASPLVATSSISAWLLHGEPESAGLVATSLVSAGAHASYKGASPLVATSTMGAGAHASYKVASAMTADSSFSSSLESNHPLSAGLIATSLVSADATVSSVGDRLYASITAESNLFLDPAGVHLFKSTAPKTPPAKAVATVLVPVRPPVPPRTVSKYSVSGAPKPPRKGFPR